jgi:CheY-like chemotaxis protein
MKHYDKNILIIDDNVEDATRILSLLKLQLSKNVGFKIDGLANVEVLSRLKGFDVIIFDINFKNGKWIEIISCIRSYHKNIPLIIFTNIVDQYYRKLCNLMGVHSHLDKTTEIDQLPQVLQEIFVKA